MIEISIVYITKPGRYHREKNELCEDIVGFREDNEYLITALADGATNCKHALQGAQCATEAALCFIGTKKSRVFDYSDSKLSYLLKEHIYCHIKMIGGKDFSEYGSTLMMMAMRKTDGKTIIMKIGNGKLVIRKNGKYFNPFLETTVRELSFLTTSRHSHYATKIFRTQLDFGDGVFMGTDGFVTMIGSKTHKPMEHTLRRLDTDAISSLVRQSESNDDLGFLCVLRNKE